MTSPTIRARGVAPVLLIAAWVMSRRAAAPSFKVLALAAVTVPPSRTNAGFRPGNLEKSALGEEREGDTYVTCTCKHMHVHVCDCLTC